MRPRSFGYLSLLTLGTLFVHGYHPWTEDASLYLPGVAKLLNPQLFPFNAQFFESHAHLTFFAELIAASVNITHLPLPYVLFSWQVISIFLLLFACWEMGNSCFTSEIAKYGGVALVATLLTLPVAGTALYIMDQYINPRNLTAFVGVLAAVEVLKRKYVIAAALLLFAAAIHPLMSVFCASFCILLFLTDKFEALPVMVAALFPLGLLDPPPQAYHQAAMSHAYFYPSRWHWYEWLGVFGPMAILWWFSRIARSRKMRNLRLVSRTLVLYQALFVVVSLAVSVPPRFESLARLQPMRSLHLTYIVFVLFAGGLLAELILKNYWWRWLALFVPLCAAIFYSQEALFPASAHIEWPGVKSRNPWVLAFEWAKDNTPSAAIFALDPDYMHKPGEDENGFSAVAQRSLLADAVTDGGAVTMFPALADEWLAQLRAQENWPNFRAPDFRRLKAKYGVTWVILQRTDQPDLQCPYQNQTIYVCRID